jgi:predicted dehydrogenase
MQSPGPESWHPNPAFLFDVGAGPLFDIGPYYLTALTQFFGPARKVAATASKARETRTIGSGPKAGEVFDVTVPTQVAALLRFASGQNATVLLSFDSPHTRAGFVEVYGTEATLAFPDPNVFDGDSALTEYRGESPTPVPATGATTGRGLGVLEMARALRAGVPHRAQGEIAAHVLDIMVGIETAIAENSIVELTSSFAEVEPMPADFDPFAATLSTQVPTA